MEDLDRCSTTKGNKKTFLFIPRKGQITISFLLIFVILFTTFMFGIVAEREMWTSGKFRSAVDAAALSAGADFARGADLFISLTAVRFGLFIISMVVYIISFVVPFPAAQSFDSVAREISGWLGKFSGAVPMIYTTKAEIDAYKEFSKNFTESEQGIKDWSINEYGIVVIPNYFIENGMKDMSTEKENSVEMLREGVSVFGYRKYSYLETFKNSFNLAETFPGDLAEWLKSHDFIISSSKIGKRSDTGIDLSDALIISNFLDLWDKGNLFKNNEQESGSSIYEKVIESAEEVVNAVKGVQGKICFQGNDLYGGSYNSTAVSKIKITVSPKDVNSEKLLDDCCNEIRNWISTCTGKEGSMANEKEDGKKVLEEKMWDENTFQGNINKMKGYAYSFIYNLESILPQIKGALVKLEEGTMEQIPDDETLEKMEKLAKSIEEIEKYAKDSKTILGKAIGDLQKFCNNSQTCSCTCSSEGKTISFNFNLSETISPMQHALTDLEGIISTCDAAKEAINDCVNEANQKTQVAVKEVKKDLSNLLETINEVLKLSQAFKGFPGGDLIAYFFKPSEYDCGDCGGKDLCKIPDVGKLGCAFVNDVEKFKNLFSEDDFEFASYYSAQLEIPPFLNEGVKTITEENFSEFLVSKVNGAIEELSNNLDQGNNLSVSEVAFKLGSTIIIAILSGGTTAIIGTLLSIIYESVLEPIIEDKIKDKLIHFLENEARHIIDELSNTKIGQNMLEDMLNEAFGKFKYIYNSIQKEQLRLIGCCDTDKYEIDRAFLNFYNSFILRVAPNGILKLGDSENFSFA